MIPPSLANWRKYLPHGFLEQTGVLAWLISTLVLALRVALIVVDQPVFVDVLRFSATTLYGLAITVGIVGISIPGMVRLYRRYRQPRSSQTRRAATARGARWPQSFNLSRTAAVSIECVIAATIIQTAINWAERTTLNWVMVLQLVGITALHIVLAVYHERVTASAMHGRNTRY